MKRLLFGVLLLVQLVAIATGQNGCCNSFLMDAPSQVALELGKTLTTRKGPGEFDNVKVKTCDNSPFYIQLWQRVDGTSGEMFRLVWQVLHRPTRIGTDSWQTINLPQRYRLEESHRLGLLTLDGERIAVPYDESSSGSVVVSTNGFSSSLNIMDDVTYSTYRFRRTFIPYVLFCDGNDCFNGEQYSSGGLRGEKGDKGDKGDPGPGGQCTFSGDANGIFGEATAVLQNQINSIEAAVQGIRTSVNSVVNSDALVTGACPRSFLQGQYGLGYCYRYMNMTRMSYGEAALTCHETNKSLPLYLESDTEEAFLTSSIIATFGPGETEKTVWTSGLYSQKLADWVWYDEKLLLRKAMPYRNWGPGYPREEDLELYNCIVLRVFKDKTSYWENVDCRERYSFICKRAKNCY